jgi:transposase-like protein
VIGLKNRLVKALKKIRTQEEFEDFIQRLYKQGVEVLLKPEINEHLGYPKHVKYSLLSDH